MKDLFTKQWITQNAIEVLREYERGILTIRGLHYRLVSRGMTNDLNHYKRVVGAMGDARWNGDVNFSAFSDNDREMIGMTIFRSVRLDDEIDRAKDQIKLWMTSYSRNKWENQYYYPEVFIEKKALQGVFESVCRREGVALGACKGYPSLTFIYDTFKRMRDAWIDGRHPIIIYFGDYDPSGEDIPRAIKENIDRLAADDNDDGSPMDIEIRRIALMEQQVIDMKLPPAPVKDGDTRSAKWDGLGQVELDAIDPKVLQKMCRDAIRDVFDPETFDAVKLQENDERITYQAQLKEFVNSL